MISTNRVRNVVMYLLNKNNLGYISPSEYDAYSQLAQQAIFEELFYDYSRWLVNKTNRRANSGYSNIPANIREMIEYELDKIYYNNGTISNLVILFIIISFVF
jgi:hypothetical protein